MEQNELYHYGVKGMKWGVRRYQNKDGTLTAAGKAKFGNDITQRKVRHVRKQVQAGLDSKTIDMTPYNKKVNKEMLKTKEHKDMERARKQLESLYKDAEKQGYSRDQVVLGPTLAKHYTNINNAYDRKIMQIGQKYADDIASTTLKSLGYDDTKAGRDWLKQQNFLDW